MNQGWHHSHRSGHGGRQAHSRVRLYRTSGEQARVAGVCSGVANYFGISPFWVRLATIASAIFFTIPTFGGYLLLALVLDREPEDLYESPEQEQFWQSLHREPAQTLASLDKKFRSMELRLRRIEAQVTSPGYRMDRDLRDSGREV